MIDKILSRVDRTALNPLDKIIQFYKTVIELEQQKEPEIKEFFLYPIIDKERNIFSLDLQTNDVFHQIYLDNKDPKTKWPKDLFIGLNATLNDKSFPLLNYIIPFNDIKDVDTSTQPVNFNLKDFSINLKTFEILEFSEEQISKMENTIKQQSTLDGISSVLKANIDETIVFENDFYLALSQKNPALSQIYSELKKINCVTIKNNSLVEQFLLNKQIDNQLFDYKEEDFIQISNLDDSQKSSIQSAFNNKLSVITGPPGTGKTQVILNILANAVLHNKKVLVASKINKAVDNVKDRFDKIDDYGFFLRFGSKKVLSDITIPEIEGIVDKIQTIEDNHQELELLKNKFDNFKQIIKENRSKLLLRDDLLKKLPELKKHLHDFEFKTTQLKDEFIKDEKSLLEENKDIDFFRQEYDIKRLDGFKSILTIQRNNIQSKNSGLRKLWFNWFEKQRYAREILNLIEQYPFEIKNYIQKEQNINVQLSKLNNGDDIFALYQKIIEVFATAIDYITKYIKLENDYKSACDSNSKILRDLNFEIAESEVIIEDITKNEAITLQIILQNGEKIKTIGKPLLTELIKHKIKNSSIPNIINYKHYLPNIIPWKDDEVQIFINVINLFLNIFNIASVTSLSAKNSFPLENELFDMVIIDEASQCDIASAVPLILRTKQLVVIGDPLQLKHISKVNDNEEAYIKENLKVSDFPFLHYNDKSLYDYCKDLLAITQTSNNFPIMLDKHYRCHPHIIGYSNEMFYSRILGKQLAICTNEANFPIKPNGILWKDVQGIQRANNININDAEVSESIKIATKLATENPSISIGIVTPFKDQAKQLNSQIPVGYIDRIVADTVYKFQGDEKDIMIYSLVVTNNSPLYKLKWIDEYVPNLVNVAVTRARNTLYIVGNKEYIRTNSNLTKPLGKLLEYVERK